MIFFVHGSLTLVHICQVPFGAKNVVMFDIEINCDTYLRSHPSSPSSPLLIPALARQACSPLIQLFFGFASDIDQANINRDIRDGNWLSRLGFLNFSRWHCNSANLENSPLFSGLKQPNLQFKYLICSALFIFFLCLQSSYTGNHLLSENRASDFMAVYKSKAINSLFSYYYSRYVDTN